MKLNTNIKNEGEDINEWIAANTVELYSTMNLCYGIVSEFCTESSCTTVCYRKNKKN